MRSLKYFICIIFSIIALSITVSAKNKCVPKAYVLELQHLLMIQ